MGILVCYDDFTYDVVTDLSLDSLDERVVGYDDSCEWEKIIIDERSESRKNGAIC